MRRLAILLLTAILVAPCPLAAADPPPAGWSEGFHYPALEDQAFVTFPWQDGFVVGGRFDAAGPVASPGVAYFDGSQWHAMGEGLDSGRVENFCVHDGALYA